MFEQVQAAAGAQDAVELGERGVGVGDGAQDERADEVLFAGVGERQVVGAGDEVFDGDPALARALEGAWVEFGLARDDAHAADLARVVGEVEAGAGADFERRVGEVGEQVLAQAVETRQAQREIHQRVEQASFVPTGHRRAS